MLFKTRYAEVLLPLPLDGVFTYAVPPSVDGQVLPGMRVVVQFGKKKLYTGLIYRINDEAPTIPVKEILSVIDIAPVVKPWQFDFWHWMSQYYMCTMGEVMNAALPPSLKLSSETRIVLHTEFKDDYSGMSEAEYRLVAVLEQRKEINITEASMICGVARIIPLIHSLITKNVVQVFEEIVERYAPKKEKIYHLADTYRNDEKALHAILDYLEKRAPKQSEVINAVLHYHEVSPGTGVSRANLLADVPASEAALRALVEKDIITETEKTISRLPKHEARFSPDDIFLTEHQQQSHESIRAAFAENKTVLLHGITSSGKTEIYIKLIDECLKQGRQALYLLPEIALTTQIISRLRKYFGDVVGVYHSRYGEAERAEVWQRVAAWTEPVDGKPTSHSVILGARSAIFLPFSKPGLIIIDEEHDTSYKQYDPSPRYHTRDSGVYLAHLHQSSVLLGTATPSLESYFNAKGGKYALVKLSKRYGDLLLPMVQIADIKEATKRKKMKSHFSPELLAALDQALANKEQAILFQNRRGFSLRMECAACNFIPECRHCDVTLIYHKRDKHLRCHYCGYSEPVPPHCPKCQSPEMNLVGFGTEKVEEELALLYPNINIARMDLDTTRSKHAHHRIISDFEEGRVDVLTGTQMVTKGLDFDNVSLVGILSADSMISYPDFRSFERSFQMMAQVSGRAGRKHKQGLVIIQTRNPKHEVIKFVIDNNYEAMFMQQLSERYQFHYPPYTRLVKLSVKHRETSPLEKAAAELGMMLKKAFPMQVLGPEYPVVSRIRNYYIMEILIKLKRDASLAPSKEKIKMMISGFLKTTEIKQLKVVADVDPV